MDQPEISYHTVSGADGLRFFRCEPHAATLSTKGCADRWEAAQRLKARHESAERREALAACRRCPLGAVHAGRDFVHVSPFYGTDQCPRCDRGTTRMIGGRVCVGCYNREREVIAGKNARGNRPERLRPVHHVGLNVLVNGQLRRERRLVVDGVEAVKQTLRSTRGRVAFAFRAPRMTWRARAMEACA